MYFVLRRKKPLRGAGAAISTKKSTWRVAVGYILSKPIIPFQEVLVFSFLKAPSPCPCGWRGKMLNEVVLFEALLVVRKQRFFFKSAKLTKVVSFHGS